MANLTKLKLGKAFYWIWLVIMLIPFEFFRENGDPLITPALALFLGLFFAFVFGTPCPKFNKKLSKYLLQASVVGLGFGMNLQQALKSGSDGMLFTVVSVIGVMVFGVLIGRAMLINRKTSYLVSAGTAICGGSAIAAVGPVIKADENEMAASLGVIFILNAIALFIFPPLGHYFDLSQQQFGTWAAIAIHDTSSVVGAGDAYGNEACELATLIKCTRALWIIPLALFTMWFFRKSNKDTQGGKGKISIPWFILYFVIAILINTYTPAFLDWVSSKTDFIQSSHILPEIQETYKWIYWAAKKALVAVLFAIGASLSVKVVKQVGVKPLIQAILLWLIIGVSSFLVVYFTID